MEHDPAEIWQRTCEVIETTLRTAGVDGRRHRRHRRHESARNCRTLGRATLASRSTTQLSGRTRARIASAASWPTTDTRTSSHRKAGLPLATYFSGPKDPLAARQCARGSCARRVGRPALRQRGYVANLEPDRRRAYHRSQQRKPYHVMDLRRPGLGRRAAGRAGHPPRHSSRNPAQQRTCLLRYDSARWSPTGRRARMRRPGRPAGGDRGPDLLRPGRGQEYLRHRLLHAAQHRRGDRPQPKRSHYDRRLPVRRPARRSMRWKVPSPWPEPPCNGCATTLR